MPQNRSLPFPLEETTTAIATTTATAEPSASPVAPIAATLLAPDDILLEAIALNEALKLVSRAFDTLPVQSLKECHKMFFAHYTLRINVARRERHANSHTPLDVKVDEQRILGDMLAELEIAIDRRENE